MEPQNTSLIKSEETALAVAKPLMYWPELSVQDIENAQLPVLSKKIILAALNQPKLSQVIGVMHENKMNYCLGFLFIKLEWPNPKKQPSDGNILTDEQICLKYAISPDDLIKIRALKNIVKIVYKCIWDSGIKMDEEEQQVLAQSITIDIWHDYANILSIEEVSIIFREGVRKKLKERNSDPKNINNDFFGLNIATFYGWIEDYITETKRQAIKLLPQVKPAISVEKKATPEEKKKLYDIWINNVVSAYNDYVTTGKFIWIDTGNLFYWFNEKNQFFKLTNTLKQTIWEEAKAEIKAEHNPANAKNKDQRMNFKEILEKIELEAAGVQSKINVRAMRLSVRHIFDMFNITEDRDFEKEIRAVQYTIKISAEPEQK